jgi:cephalosporin-C deacetylase-like acetyl esterase
MHLRTGLGRICSALSVILVVLAAASAAFPQAQKERTLDEIKTEAIKRAENGMYPLIGIDPTDLREAFASIKTTDKDEWAAAFMAVAGRYNAEAISLEKSDPAKANANYIRAWRLYSFGRWPVPASPGKQRSYLKAMEAFRAHARFWDPPLEIVHIPFEGSEIVGYLRLPKSTQGPVPLVLAISGLDSRKEDLSENFSVILQHGIGFFAVDGPGTGQAPIKVSPTADRMFSRVLDYLQTRPEVDKTRIAVHGVSWGGYWGTKLAIVERERLKAVSAQSPAAHLFFQKDYMLNSMFGNREYLFDHAPAFMSVVEGVNNVDDMVARFPKLSLVDQQLLGKPTAPMLIVTGALDTQVPVSDAYLILSNGDVPKEAWINPQGGHLGRQVKVWPDPVIFRQVIIPWLVRKLEVGSNEPTK